jgi:hypothetical protein
MSRHVFRIERGFFGLSLTPPASTDPCAATIAEYSDFGCQITDGALNASPNTTAETIPATWCEPEEQITNVGRTSFSVDLGYLQDPDIVDGLSQFLFEHDAEVAYFYMGMAGDDPPKAIGELRLQSGTIGGPGRATLTATVSLPVTGKPSVCFGNASDSEPVDGNNVSAAFTAATGVAPSSFANLAAIGADPTVGDGNLTGFTFDSDEYVLLGDDSDAHYDGAIWVAGPMP